MEKTAIILAGGVSKRFGQDKALVQIAGKPLISRVYERARGTVEEVIIVVSSDFQRESYAPLFPSETRLAVDVAGSKGPLAGALTGLMNARGEYSILLPSDTPFISVQVMRLLFEISQGLDAVIPRWPNGYIEPLQAVYRTSSALASAKEAFQRGETRLQSMISRLKRVRYISTLVIRQMDQDLTTFYNINAPVDLRKAEQMIEKKMDL